MIDLSLMVKEFLAIKANQEELTKRVEVLEDEIVILKMSVGGARYTHCKDLYYGG